MKNNQNSILIGSDFESLNHLTRIQKKIIRENKNGIIWLVGNRLMRQDSEGWTEL